MSPDGSAADGPLPTLGALGSLSRARRFRRDSLAVVQEMHDRHGPIVLERVGTRRLVHLFGPDANELVMRDRGGIFSAQRAWTLIMGRIFPGGLLLMDGSAHRHQRRILQAAFTRSALQGYLAAMTPRITETIDELPADGTTVHAFTAYKRMTLELACAVFLGMELDARAGAVSRAFEHMVAASMSIVRLPIPGLEFQRGLAGRRFLVGLFDGMIADKRRDDDDDLFSQLCRAQDEEGQRLTDGEVVDHIAFLMMAAHDTTTSTLASLTYELGRHPEWQERIREELLALGPELTHDNMLELTQLNLALQETLRRYPPLSTVPRIATRPFEFMGREIPPAMVVTYPIHTHHMPALWSEPMRFDPGRFAAPREEHKRHTHGYVPFSGGAHICIGMRFAEMQIRAVMFQLLRRYRIKLADGYVMPVQQAPISKPLDGLPIMLERV